MYDCCRLPLRCADSYDIENKLGSIHVELAAKPSKERMWIGRSALDCDSIQVFVDGGTIAGAGIAEDAVHWEFKQFPACFTISSTCWEQCSLEVHYVKDHTGVWERAKAAAGRMLKPGAEGEQDPQGNDKGQPAAVTVLPFADLLLPGNLVGHGCRVSGHKTWTQHHSERIRGGYQQKFAYRLQYTPPCFSAASIRQAATGGE
jgi:hypothetical protein